MSPKLKKAIQYGFFFAIGIGLMIWQYQKMSEAEKDTFVESIKSASLLYLFPVIIMALISHWSRAIRWRYLIQSMGYKAKIGNTFAAVMIGYLVNTLVPRAGEIAKCTLLGKREKIPADKLLGTIIIERAIDMACYILLIMITILLQYNRIKSFVAEKFDQSVRTSSIHPGIKISIIIAVLILVTLLFKWLYKKNKSNKIFTKINSTLLGLKEGVSSIKKLEYKKAFWLHTILIWSMYLLQIYVGFQAMLFTKNLGIDAATAILTMGTLAMILTPGGIGAFPVAVGEVLVLFGNTEPQGLAFGWVIWGVSTCITVVVGAACAIWFEKSKTKENAV